MKAKIMDRIKMSFFFLRKMYSYSKSFFCAQSIRSLMQVGVVYATIFLPKMIIDSLNTEATGRAVIFSVFYAIIFFTERTVGIWIEAYCKKKTAEFQEVLVTELSQTAMRIPYSELESFSVREEYELAQKCISRDSVMKLLQSTWNTVFVFLTVSGIFFIVGYLVWWMWLVLFASVVTEIACELVRIKYNYESYETQNIAEMNMCYSRDWMTRRKHAKEVRLYGMLPYIRKQTRYWIEELAAIQKERTKKTFQALWWSHFANGALIFIVYCYIGILCLRHILGVGDFVMSVSAVFELNRSAVQIAKTFLVFAEEGNYIQAYQRFLNREGRDGTKHVYIGRAPRFSFDHVAFRYEGAEKNAVEQLNITIEPARHYGVVGLNGAGKSTFIKLLMGLYTPTEGMITCDGIHIEEIRKEEYWELFSATFQDYRIFDVGADQNIAAQKQPSQERCYDAAKKAGILDKIQSFPEQFQTILGCEFKEDGAELSDGEKQKLALARMIYKDAPVWILDEPTASLSPQSEYELYKQLGQLTKNKTVIFISHRLASCRFCDEVLVFDQSCVAERGTHEELMAMGGLYKKMFDAQSKYYDVKYREDPLEGAKEA